MHIEFFGSSITASGKDHNRFETFKDLILNDYKAVSFNIDHALCSEERILYNLKKTGEIDIALIFHSSPKEVYWPNFSRDFTYMDEERRLNQVNYKSLYSYLQPESLGKAKSLHLLDMFYDYFYNKDVTTNRYYGALTQINDYVFTKKIPTIHFVSNLKHIPSWFEFKSGIVDKKIIFNWDKDSSSLSKDYHCSYSKSANAITQEGNIIMFELIKEYIEKLKN
jgi:hypothetical protein